MQGRPGASGDLDSRLGSVVPLGREAGCGGRRRSSSGSSSPPSHPVSATGAIQSAAPVSPSGWSIANPVLNPEPVAGLRAHPLTDVQVGPAVLRLMLTTVATNWVTLALVRCKALPVVIGRGATAPDRTHLTDISSAIRARHRSRVLAVKAPAPLAHDRVLAPDRTASGGLQTSIVRGA